MSEDVRDRLRQIFDEVMQTPVDSRPDVLKDLCGDDDRAYSKIAALLDETVEPDRDRFVEETATYLGDTSIRGRKPADELTDEQFGHFRLERELARGGMGVVFKARDEKLDRTVALKMVLTGRLASEDEVRRFQTEAQAAAGLDHPNIVPVYEAGEFEGRQYLSMAFVDGTSLQDKANGQPLPPREAAELIAVIARAIQHAHEHGIVHRDLKPSNVLLDKQGTPRVADFGLAKRIETDASLTATGQVMGTPHFMAPEQAAAKHAQIGPLSDVYSLGAMLYVLLTGRPPFQAATIVETMKQLLENDPVSPRVLNPAVPRDLETICLRCLAKQPSDRFFTTAEELADDLQRFLDDEPVRVRRVGVASRIGRWCRKTWRERRRWIVATGIVATLAIVAFVVSLQFREQGRRDAELADLRSRFEAGLKTKGWSNDHLQEMDGLVASLEKTQAGAGDEARQRLHARFAEIIRSAIRQPKIDNAATRQIERWLALMKVRNADAAQQLRREFTARQARMEFVFQLESPFDAIDDVFQPEQVSLNDSRLLRRGAHRRLSPLLTKVVDSDHVSLEAVFGPKWLDATTLGLALNAGPKRGYVFELRTSPNGQGRSRSFRTVRRLAGTYILRILRDGKLLRTTYVSADKLPVDRLKIVATREGQRLAVSVNNETPLVFFDIFPLAANAESRYGVMWPPGVSLQRLYGSRRLLPPAPSALEQGDRLYLAGDYTAARAFYQKQQVQSATTIAGLESQVKEALCLMATKQLNAAGTILEAAVHRSTNATGNGKLWRDVALSQLLLTRIRQKRYDDAEALIEQMLVSQGSGNKAGFTLSTVTPSTLQTEVLAHFKQNTGGVRLWNPDPNRIKKIELAIQVEKILELDKVYGMWTELELVRAHRARGDVNRAMETAKSFIKDMPLDARGFHTLIIREFAWMSRTAHPAGPQRDAAIRKALVEVDKRLFRDPQASDPAKRFRPWLHELLLERARLHAALGDSRQAASDIDAFFAHAPDPQAGYRIYSDACLLRGFLYEEAGDSKRALEYWKKALYPGDVNVTKLNSHFGGSISIVNALMAAGLTKGMQEVDLEKMIVSVMSFFYPGPTAKRFMSLAKSGGIRPIMLSDMWRTPRGREVARKMVFQTVPFKEYMRLPAVLLASHMANATAVTGKPTKDQQRVIWEAFDEAITKTFSGEIEVGFFQVAALGTVWKGLPTGWVFLKAKFPKPLRAKASYVLGLRYRKLGKSPQAITFFRAAIADASGNKILEKLAKAELSQLTKP